MLSALLKSRKHSIMDVLANAGKLLKHIKHPVLAANAARRTEPAHWTRARILCPCARVKQALEWLHCAPQTLEAAHALELSSAVLLQTLVPALVSASLIRWLQSCLGLRLNRAAHAHVERLRMRMSRVCKMG